MPTPLSSKSMTQFISSQISLVYLKIPGHACIQGLIHLIALLTYLCSTSLRLECSEILERSGKTAVIAQEVENLA